MEKTNSFRFKIFGLLCTLLLCLGSLPAVGQNCPNFQWNDFTKTMVHPNADCNLPGSLTIYCCPLNFKTPQFPYPQCLSIGVADFFLEK